MQVVLVKFLDPVTCGHWSSLAEMEETKPRLCVACGLLWTENNEIVRVGLLADADKESASDWITIPAGCVKSVEVIKEVDWNG